MATRKLLNVGLVPNDGRGDSLRDAAEKIEYNFNLLFDEKEVEVAGITGNLSVGGLSVIEGGAMTLSAGTEVGEKKEIVNISGTSTIVGQFGNGTIVEMVGPSACSMVWSGASWILFSDNGITES